jgi:hypothetical protein
MKRREYDISVTVNFRVYTKVVIDPHYEEKHAESIDDKIILKLVQMLDREVHVPRAKDEEGFEYFVREDLVLNKKTYRLIWLTHQNEIFIGVVNAYRRD